MTKDCKLVIILLAAVILIGMLPLFLLKNAEFAGSDDGASEVVEEVDTGYTPWFTPVIESFLGRELPGEVESLFFCIQTGIGTIIIGFVAGRLYQRKKDEKNDH